MPDDDALKRCEEEKRFLKAENEDLRHSAEDFGELAERLNRQLHADRRVGADRREAPRQSADRRQPAKT